MKTVIATLKPFKLDEVRQALSDLGFTGFRVIETKGFGRQKGHMELFHGTEYTVDFLPKVDLIITVQDKDADRVVQGILQVARTGSNRGDGRITVIPTEQFWNIRTGENEADEENNAAKVETVG